LRRQLERAAQDAVDQAQAALRPVLEHTQAALRAAEADVAELRAALHSRDAALSDLNALLEAARQQAADADAQAAAAAAAESSARQREAELSMQLASSHAVGDSVAITPEQQQRQQEAQPWQMTPRSAGCAVSGGSIANSPAFQALRQQRPSGARGLFAVYFIAVHAALSAVSKTRGAAAAAAVEAATDGGDRTAAPGGTASPAAAVNVSGSGAVEEAPAAAEEGVGVRGRLSDAFTAAALQSASASDWPPELAGLSSSGMAAQGSSDGGGGSDGAGVDHQPITSALPSDQAAAVAFTGSGGGSGALDDVLL